MSPLTKEEREAILRSHPNAEPGTINNDIDEYESLVAMRFAQDPSRAPAAQPLVRGSMNAKSRLAELHEKLFEN